MLLRPSLPRAGPWDNSAALLLHAAWSVDREVACRCTKEGLAAARARGKTLGRRIAQVLEVDEKTVRNAFKSEAPLHRSSGRRI